MLSTLILASALAVHPARELVADHPDSSVVAGGDGQRLVHASGLLSDPGARRPEDAAGEFVSRYGAAFGVTSRQVLVLRGAPAVGEFGPVRFARTIDGLEVFGGDLVVGVDGRNRVVVVNGADVPPAVSGRHALGEAGARSAAASSFPNAVRGAGPAAVAAGWRAFGSSLRAVYRVDFIAEVPAGDWRVFVDGETGSVLFREDLRYYGAAQGSVFEVSPVETSASACPMSGAAHSFCANPVTVTFPNLSTGADLTGTQTSAYNCKGADAPTSAAGVPGTCASVNAVGGALGGSTFSFAPDATSQLSADDFGAAMAYYHLDKHVSFFKSLDPALPPGGPAAATPTASSRALRGSLPALVNTFQNGAPYENAYFSGLLDAMVFGQGATSDYAYDATVMYHEFTHGAVFAWGGFNIDLDSLGGLDEPGAVNEATADAMAVSETGRSAVGSYLGATATPAFAAARDMDDPNASRTCQGDGTIVNQLGTTTPFFVNGLDGEVHDDGQIWSSFFWEVYQGLQAAGARACGGACDAGPALQYKAMQLAGGTSPTFKSYWLTMKSAASALFPEQSGAGAYVDCVARRRKLDRCDRTVPVYAGESKLQYVRLRYSPFQVALPAVGPTQLRVCSAKGTTTTLHARKSAPVQLTSIDPDTLAATFSEDVSWTFTQLCSAGEVTLSLPSGAATWYLLFDSPNALVGATPGHDIYRIDASRTGIASRPASAAAPTCVPPFLAVTPASASARPNGTVLFTASGGSGSGYAWSLVANASGSSVSSTGAYTAGPTSGVTDVVQVTDSFGNTATRDVTVERASSASAGCGCGTTAAAPATLWLGVALVLSRWRKRAGRPSRGEG